MIRVSELRKEDYWQIRWPLAWLFISLVLAIGLFLLANSLQNSISSKVFIAQAQLQDARTSVSKIEEEEATIIEYIGRYKQIEAEGSIRDEDRLQLLEWLARMRAELSLFPIQINVDSQQKIPLQYKNARGESGRPVTLRASAVDIRLPLLHEEDLVRLLSALRSRPGLLQPEQCTLTARDQQDASYINLAQHFNAACSFLWYTFEVQAVTAEPGL